jgi:ferredoxin-nitrate reductase
MATTSRPSAGADVDRTRDPWGTPAPFALGAEWPIRVDQHLTVEPAEVQSWHPSACVLCSNGCALDIGVKDGRIVGVRGRGEDRVNHGRLGPKGLYGWQANHAPDRLTRPMIRRNGELREASWDEAMSEIVDHTRQVLDKVGPLGIGFYTSGQLFLEEYYTLAVITKAGLGTPHTDGNTRLCTATAAAALKESFGSDGQPGSYRDIDFCDTLCLYGHNVAETQTVLWARMRDRLEGPNPPRLIVVDPRPTAPAKRADLHLAPMPGTNLALMNGILHELIRDDSVDKAWVKEHTIGFEELKRIVEQYPAETVAEICRVDAADIRKAAVMIAESQRLVSTVLQGFYQSNQATAAAVQVNNIHLLRNQIGRPGSAVLQMNGQPTAQNTRETGADGDMPGFRNWNNEQHMQELARVWNVEPMTIPHWSEPTHAMEMFRYAEQGSISMLWVSATNPAMSLPELRRIRELLQKPELYVVVQDAFLTETARLADVVLPAAIWAEKTGTFTNADRTVHLSEKAVNPPGEARSDLDIWLDYARRMEFKDKDGRPLITWEDPESAFEAWKQCSQGRFCDYTGLSYSVLRERGIQWPCSPEHPGGTERLYADGRFRTAVEDAETYGHDLLTGAAVTEVKYRAANPAGRAFLKGCHFKPPQEQPDQEYPLGLTTGRLVHHFHTRTKTGRAPELQRAAPDVWIEASQEDADRARLQDGQLAQLRSRRGRLVGRLRIAAIKPGTVFVPFHYGYWDEPGGFKPNGKARAANELTLTGWDPVSKQPYLKAGTVKLEAAPSGEA